MGEEPEPPRARSRDDKEATEVKIGKLSLGGRTKGMLGGNRTRRMHHRKFSSGDFNASGMGPIGDRVKFF